MPPEWSVVITALRVVVADRKIISGLGAKPQPFDEFELAWSARLVDAIAKGRGKVDPLLTRIGTLRQEAREIAGQLAQLAGSSEIVTLHPASIERYARDVRALTDVAERHGDLPESGELVAMPHRLVQEVIVHAAPNAQGFTIEVKGRLAELTGSSAFPTRSGGDRW